jgi:hypothetical protein
MDNKRPELSMKDIRYCIALVLGYALLHELLIQHAGQLKRASSYSSGLQQAQLAVLAY